jgi:hypothetical protein
MQNPMRDHRVFCFPDPLQACLHKEEENKKLLAAQPQRVLHLLTGNLRMKGSGEANPVLL